MIVDCSNTLPKILFSALGDFEKNPLHLSNKLEPPKP